MQIDESEGQGVRVELPTSIVARLTMVGGTGESIIGLASGRVTDPVGRIGAGESRDRET
jgi:hypothetical protein